jgi:signal transduction histidine kinase
MPLNLLQGGEITISVIELKHNDEDGNGEIQVNIKDTGTGLSPAILPKLFSNSSYIFLLYDLN